MEENNLTLGTVPGHGDPYTMTDEEVELLKAKLRHIVNTEENSDQYRRYWAESSRFARWEGQSPDGRKRKESLGHEPFPFEGASDARIRLSDGQISLMVSILLNSMRRMTMNVTGVDSADEEKAIKVARLMKWVKSNLLRDKYRRELERLANFMLGDTPGLGVMHVAWREEKGLQITRVTREDVLFTWKEILKKDFGSEEEIPEDMVFRAQASLEGIGGDEEFSEAISLVSTLAPEGWDERTIREKTEELVHDGFTNWPTEYLRINEPKLTALRSNEDVWWDRSAHHIQEAPELLMREWLNEADLRARIDTDGYDEGWVEEVIKSHKGKSALPYAFTEWQNDIRGDYSEQGWGRGDDELHKEDYEILEIYHRAANKDGVVGVYTVPWHHEMDRAAKDRMLVDFDHGMYPFVVLTRENISRQLTDSRGMAELGASAQESMKRLFDMSDDYTSLTTIPPLLTKRRKRINLMMGPMSQTPVKNMDELKFMEMPDQPRMNLDLMERIDHFSSWYFGIPSPDIPEEVTIARQQKLIDDWNSGLREIDFMMLQLCLQYLTDDQVQRVVDGGISIAESMDEIRGMYDIEISFDAQELIPGFAIKKLETIGKIILPMDTTSTVQRDKLVQFAMRMVDPTIADATLRSVKDADRSEMEDEQLNFVKIRSGVQPPMNMEGQNFKLRMRTLEAIVEGNPEIMEDWPEKSKEMLQERVKFLQHQIQQERNAVTGRLGVDPGN